MSKLLNKCPEEKCRFWDWIYNISDPLHKSEKGCTNTDGCIREFYDMPDNCSLSMNSKLIVHNKIGDSYE